MEEVDILSGQFAATRTRYDDCTGPILLILDTTEFSYQRANKSAIGITKSVNSGRDEGGRWRHHTGGMLMHSSLAVTVEGIPLGFAAVKFWTRKKFKGTAQLKKKVNPTRVPIEKKESVRWLTISGNRSNGSDSRSVAFISATAKATSTNCIA
ncbi:hypothetical protein IVB57_29990 [Bradyrhizobium sp. CW9]|uniref:hypothetical protein n=1 Tax=Bradyrhizobium sp. CW9 TaxID=2782689 RepID=UPI001FF9B910|nr:hypothetical protein [Bradyrhizobium sp. CW9]MCK1332496.1 hypothetical protein [Bradyrhizobium sp. CW9]